MSLAICLSIIYFYLRLCVSIRRCCFLVHLSMYMYVYPSIFVAGWLTCVSVCIYIYSQLCTYMFTDRLIHLFTDTYICVTCCVLSSSLYSCLCVYLLMYRLTFFRVIGPLINICVNPFMYSFVSLWFSLALEMQIRCQKCEFGVGVHLGVGLRNQDRACPANET